MRTLTEKVNGRREWSVYGFSELQKITTDDDAILRSIIVSNALNECNIKRIGHRSFKFGSKLFLYITKDGVVVVKGLHGKIEEIKDPRLLFDRIRVVWENFHV